MRAVQRDHAHHWNWPRREAVPFAPGCVGRAQRCYCGSTRYRNVRCESPVEPEADENSERPSTDLVVRRDIRRRLIARPRIAGGAGPFFWVGGTGTWDNATNTHWALTTGGAGGAGIPTAADNVTFDNSSGLTSNTTVTIAATAACNNLTIGSIAQASAAFTLSGNFTVSGTASVQGNAPTQRPIFNSSAVGTQRTLTLTTVSALANIDFMDIKGAGGLATFAGTSIGDAQGNATINFTASRTLYWVATSGGSWNVTTSWSLTTGGASGQNPPLPQDDVNFDSNSITSAGHTITVNLVRSGRNITVTLAWATTWTYSTNWSGYGSLDFFASVSGGASLITFTSASTQTLRGRGNHGFNPPHQGSPVFSQGWQFIAPGGTYTIDTDWETSVSAASAVGFSVVNGAIAFGGVAVHFTTTSLNLSGAAASIDFTNLFQIIITGTQNTSSGYVWNANAAASVTISFANIILSDASANNKTFIGGAHTYYTFNVTTATANGYIFTGANHYGVFTLTAGLVMFSVATHTFTNFIANNGAGGLLVQSQTGGSQATLAAEAGIGGFSWKGVTVQDITTSAALTIWVTSGVNTSNNGARVIFAAPSRSYAPTQSQSPTLIATDKRTFKPSGQSQTPTLKSTDKRTFVPTLSYFSQVLEEEPTAYWRLDELSGTAATDVQGTYPAQYHGGFTLAQAGAVDGDDAVALDGTTGYILVPVVAGIHPATFTYEAWIYPTVSSGVDKAIFASRGSNRGILWWINGTALSAYLYDGAVAHQFTNTAAIPTINTWYHVALTFDGTTATMYVNGAARATTLALSTYVPQTTSGLTIGRDSSSAAFYFPGTMDEPAVYSYALSAAEVSDHYQAGLGNLTGQTQTSQIVANPRRTLKPSGQSQTLSTTTSDSRALRLTQSQGVSFKEPVSRAFPSDQSQTPTLVSTDNRAFKPSGQNQAAALVRNPKRTFRPSQSQATTMQASDARTFAPTQSQSVTFQGSDSRTFKVTQSQSTAVIRTATRLFKPTQSQSVATVRAAARSFTPTQSQTPRLTTVIQRPLPLSQSASPALVRALARSLGASQAATTTLGARQATRTLAPTQAQALTVREAASRALAATQSAAAGLTGGVGRSTALTQAQGAALVRALARSLRSSQSQSPGLTRALARVLARTQAGATVLTRTATHAFGLAQDADVAVARVIGRVLARTTQATAVALVRTLVRVSQVAQDAACYTVRCSTGALAAGQGQGVGMVGVSPHDHYAGQGQAVVVLADPGRSFGGLQAAAASMGPPSVQRTMLATQAGVATLGSRYRSRALSATAPQSVVVIVVPRRSLMAHQSSAVGLRRGIARSRSLSQAGAIRITRNVRRTTHIAQSESAIVARSRRRTFTLGALQAPRISSTLSRSLRRGQAASVGVRRAVGRSYSLTQSQHAVRWIPPTAGILIVADSQGGGGVSSTSSGGFVRVTSPGLPVSATDGRISTEDGQGSIGVEGIDQVKTSVQATGILTVEAR